MQRLGAIYLWLLLPAAALAQTDPPAAGRPVDFSGIVGQYTIEATAAPTTVHVEDPILLRVRISGRGPEKYQPRREALRLFPADWDDDFYVEPVPAEDRRDDGAGSWEFAYRLRPKHDRIEAIRGLKLVYYDPMRRRYQSAYPEADMPLSVKPRPALRTDWDVAIHPAPASFYTLPPIDAGVTAAEPQLPAIWWLVLVALVPPAACLLGYHLVRHWSRSEAGARSPAAQHAFKELDAGSAAWLVVKDYLQARLGYPGAEVTPGDAAAFLKRRGLARPVCDQARMFFQACDAARFTPLANGATGALHSQALSLIRAVESDRCLA